MLYLLCHYSGNCCALQAESILEILPLAQLRASGTVGAARSEPALRGILDYRGTPLKVYDLGLLHGAEACRELVSTRIVILRYDEHTVGLLAEEVYDMIHPDGAEHPQSGQNENGMWLRYEGELIHCLEPQRIFQEVSDGQPR